MAAVRRSQPGTVPLVRALSKLGLCSRRQAIDLVLAGRVAVDGIVVTDPGLPVVPERSRFVFDGVTAERPEALTLLLYKPRGVVSTRRDPQGRPTVFDLVAGWGRHLAAVGRLDLATSGLLLLTSETALADWLCDPGSGVPRVYLVTVRGEVNDEAVARALAGVVERGEKLTAAAVTVRKRSRRESHLVVTLCEGRNREIRRLFAALGHEVTALKRVGFGPLTLGELAPGEARELSRDELRRAFPAWPGWKRTEAKRGIVPATR